MGLQVFVSILLDCKRFFWKKKMKSLTALPHIVKKEQVTINKTQSRQGELLPWHETQLALLSRWSDLERPQCTQVRLFGSTCCTKSEVPEFLCNSMPCPTWTPHLVWHYCELVMRQFEKSMSNWFPWFDSCLVVPIKIITFATLCVTFVPSNTGNISHNDIFNV